MTKEYSHRFILARDRFIELCEEFGPFEPKQTIALGNLWREYADRDNGDGEIVAVFVLNFSQQLHSKVRN